MLGVVRRRSQRRLTPDTALTLASASRILSPAEQEYGAFSKGKNKRRRFLSHQRTGKRTLVLRPLWTALKDSYVSSSGAGRLQSVKPPLAMKGDRQMIELR